MRCKVEMHSFLFPIATAMSRTVKLAGLAACMGSMVFGSVAHATESMDATSVSAAASIDSTASAVEAAPLKAHAKHVAKHVHHAAASSAKAAAPVASWIKDGIAGGLFGNVALIKPQGPMRGFVVLYSGSAGWQASDRKTADALAAAGAMVVGVDIPSYAAKLAVTKEDPLGCHYLVGDAEALGHQLQREAHSSRYFLPILAGTGQGALVAERTLGRAPSNTLSGAVVLDPDTKLDPRFNPCIPDQTIDRGNGLVGFLSTASTTGQDVTPVIATGGKSIITRHFDKDTSHTDALLTLIKPYLTVTTETADDVSDLPLVVLPAAQPSDKMAIVISGDGGWRDLDKTIAESLQKKGVQVVGIDALRYFWSEKSPQQTTHDIERIIHVYGDRWHTKHIALIGYSFGADVMPFVYNRLPSDLKDEVSLVSLLGFAPNADFQIRVIGWLGMPASHAALPALPETDKIPASMLQCFYGVSETDTACPELAKRGVALVKTDGGHHFGGDYGDLANDILARWAAEIAKRAAQ